MAEGRRIIIKKKGGGHGHHGGAWKVAYADFVTAMMALFMVMWLLASTDDQSRQEISRYFRTGILPDGDMAMSRAAQAKPSVIETATQAPKKKGTDTETEARELGSAIESMIKADPDLAKLASQVSISIGEDGVLIEAVDRDGQSMLFDLASSELKPALVEFLGKLGGLLTQRGSKIRVMGHTDARPLISKTGRTNWDLSYERASNARRVLEAAGLGLGQITSVQAHGASQPRNPLDPYAAENRRLSVLVLHQPAPGAEGEKDGEKDGAAAPASGQKAALPLGENPIAEVPGAPEADSPAAEKPAGDTVAAKPAAEQPAGTPATAPAAVAPAATTPVEKPAATTVAGSPAQP
ncbi:MAG TPA: flagellar motor protein MotB [Kofleriaceae bacterium]|nr:flagellar motor protein MotB [Kofleriaceae bacterium]